MISAVTDYIHELRRVQHGTAELARYTPLINLLNKIGMTLKPQVRAESNLRNLGAGSPDVGLFADQQGAGQLPERGVIEVKAPTAELQSIIESDQVIKKYLPLYDQVLVTNYWSFALVAYDGHGEPTVLEVFQLAADETAFWEAARNPSQLTREHGQQLVEYLMRVMLRPTALSRPRDVAWFLASYARDALARVNAAGDEALPGLAMIRRALEDTLGVHFEAKEGDQFFGSTMVQTLFYGIFSAWVLWHNQNPMRHDHFDWRTSAYELRVPVIQVLFEQLAVPSRLRVLNLEEVLEWVGGVLNRVNREEFFGHFEEDQAVQYFYEPFLEAFSPDLRKALGVWYTPQEIVKYMVERVDTVLREDLGLAGGLANENVYVLDPAAGTGAYLVEVLQKIVQTERDSGNAALAAASVKRAVQERIFGFELLPAAYVISHLQVGLLLQELGAPFSNAQRANIFLTNSLIGWDLGRDEPTRRALPFPQFEQERDAAQAVKRHKPILVVIGNPPYNAYAGVSPDEEQGLVDPYKEGLVDKWHIKKFNLDELYVRFFRIAEHRIAEVSGRGIVCYISNFSYLGEPSFVVMRKHLLSNFDRIWIDSLNGDSRETGKRTPSGKPDPSVFSTEYNPVGIRKGTAVGLLLKSSDTEDFASVWFRNFWGVKKRQELLNSLDDPDIKKSYRRAEPREENRFSFRPLNIHARYREWPSVVELSKTYPLNGPIERRGNSLIVLGNEKQVLISNLKAYLDPEVSNARIFELSPRYMTSSGEFVADRTRQLLKGNVKFKEHCIRRYQFKPFDIRLAYLDSEIQPLFSRPSPELLEIDRVPENSYFITRVTADKREEGVPFLFSSLVCDYDCISGHARHFPLLLPVSQMRQTKNQLPLFSEAESMGPLIEPNISEEGKKYLLDILSEAPDAHAASRYIWFHTLAIGYSGIYLDDNFDGIKIDWPRIPLPASKELLLASAELGERLGRLLDATYNGNAVNNEIPDDLVNAIGPIVKVDGGPLDQDKHFGVTVGWGYLQQGYITMPGSGSYIERPYTRDELDAFGDVAKAVGMDLDQVLSLLGGKTLDLNLNDVAYWKNVPENVWNYTVGGYQVIKKWLSYRDKRVIGRDLLLAEVQEVSKMARRIATIILLQPQLDANYLAVKANTYDWPQD